MRRTFLSLAAAPLFLFLLPPSAEAQVGRAAVGGALGVAGGAAVTLAAVVARARFQREYLGSPDDLIHWQSAPMILAPAVGVMFGLAGEDALRASIVGSTAGFVVGAGIGAGLGWMLGRDAEAPWAGGVIGAGLGLASVGIVEGLRAWSEDGEAGLEFPDLLRFSLSFPVR